MNKINFILALALTIFFSTTSAFAIGQGDPCSFIDTRYNNACDSGLYCKALPGTTQTGTCEKAIGKSDPCNPSDNLSNHGCDPTLTCKSLPGGFGSCESSPTAPKISAGGNCEPRNPDPCVDNYSCKPDPRNPDFYKCQANITPVNPAQSGGTNEFSSIFGKIQLPEALRGLNSKDPSGAGGISQLLSNLVGLFYTVAAVVLIFMLLWGAFDWMTSEGEKEKIHSAQQKIMNAIIGIILFAITFAVIQVLGTFTGFKFFVGQGT